MAIKLPSHRRAMIDKANTVTLAVAAGAAFIVVFSLVSCQALVSQLMYQDRVATAKQAALNQLTADNANASKLTNSYKGFDNTPQNVIGGNSSGSGPNDGDSGEIVLDALPGSYDFPALTTSVQALLASQSVKIDSITGSDQQLTQDSQAPVSSPSPVAMPFGFSVDGGYQGIVNTVSAFEASIRPFQFQTIEISGNQSDLSFNATLQTYYQQSKTFSVSEETVK